MTSATITLSMDGRELSAPVGSTLLQVARRNGIDIPTLCYHESVSPYGGCRLCVVEIGRGTRSKMVASCLYEVEPGLVVKTDSPWVRETRRMILDLLLAQCPRSKAIQELARQYGLEKSSFPSEDEDNLCMLCGLCVRACQEVVGVSAISLADRGTRREVATPFGEPSQTCIGCGSCVYICPTGAIKMEDKKGFRYLYNWKVAFKLQRCKACGNYFAPERQLEYIQQKLKLPQDFFAVCPTCRS